MVFLKNILDFEKKTIQKISKNPMYLKIVALIITLGLFLVINGTGILKIDQFFETTEYFDDIPLNYVIGDDKVLLGIPETIGVNVTGSESEIKQFEKNSSNVSATVDLTGVEDGLYEIKPEEIEFSNKYGARIEPTQSFYNVDIDTLTTITEPIEVSYINQNGIPIILDPPKLESSNVTFKIGMQQKEEVGTVRVLLDLSKINLEDNKDSYTFNEEIKVYNKDGHLIDTHTKLPTVEVVQGYSTNLTTLPIKYNVINNNTGKYISEIIRDDGNPNDVEVYGEQSQIANVDYASYTIDMSEIDEANPYVEATPTLEDGIYPIDETPIKVKLNLEEGDTKVLESVPITVNYLDSKYKAQNFSDVSVDVTVTGAKTKIEDLNKKDVKLYADASNVTGTGKYSLSLKTNIDSIMDVKLSKNKVTVNIVKKENDE